MHDPGNDWGIAMRAADERARPPKESRDKDTERLVTYLAPKLARGDVGAAIDLLEALRRYFTHIGRVRERHLGRGARRDRQTCRIAEAATAAQDDIERAIDAASVSLSSQGESHWRDLRALRSSLHARFREDDAALHGTYLACGLVDRPSSAEGRPSSYESCSARV